MTKNIKACLTSNNIHWATPTKLYEAFIKAGFTDPCPLNAHFNGLELNYENCKLFVNPPFKDLSLWVDWCIKQFENGCHVVILMPARTDTAYFYKLTSLGAKIYFIKGRLHFNDSNKNAPFPTILVKLNGNIFDYKSYGCFTLDELINDLKSEKE